MNSPELQKQRLAASYVLAMAVSRIYPSAQFGTYTLTEDGFSYDFLIPNQSISEHDLEAIETEMKGIIEQSLQFSSTTRTTEEAHDFYVSLNQPFKLETLEASKAKKHTFVVVGDNAFVDMGKIPAVYSTREVGFISLRSVAGAYWNGDEQRQMLTRIYGVSFPSRDELELYIAYREEAQRRDHRTLAKKLSYTITDPGIGQGLMVFRPRGAYAMQELQRFIEDFYVNNDFMPVISPRISLREFWTNLGVTNPKALLYENLKASGKDAVTVSPTNAPFHLLSFYVRQRSYRDLPWRTYEVSQLYRKEKVSDLSGLYTTRQVTLDETFTVCSRDQVEIELETQFSQIMEVLRSFGLADFEIQLHSTISDLHKSDSAYSEWDSCNTFLKNMIRKSGYSYREIAEITHDRGPKVYVVVRDAVKRQRQLSSIGFDLVIPYKMELQYTGKDGQQHSPLVIRRTVLGSLERFLSVIMEQTIGNLPLWLQYEKCRIIPITNKNELYAETVQRRLHEAGIISTIDYSNEPIEGKIKQCEEDKVPYSIIVGEKEQKVNGISIRLQGVGDIGLITIDTFIASLLEEIKTKSIKTLLV